MESEETGQPLKKKTPSPVFVALVSLFGYPGVGHLMVGARKTGVSIILMFTVLTVGVLIEIWVMVRPLLALYQQGALGDILVGQGLTGLPLPTWWRLLLWLVLTGAVWVGSAVHSFALARNQ